MDGLRLKSAVLLILCLLLTGCSSSDDTMASAMAFRTELVQSGGCTFTAQVTADFGDSVREFAMDCCSDEKGNVSFTLKEPETLEGITGSVTDAGGKITYDGMSAEFGLLADEKVIPAAAPAIAASCWAGEYISCTGMEDELCRVTCEKGFEKKLIVDTWFQNQVPICCEMCYNGTEILKMEITDFQMN